MALTVALCKISESFKTSESYSGVALLLEARCKT